MLTTALPWRERGLGLGVTERVVLAVSGGADSMVMASELFGRSPGLVAAVATFDHGSGRAASDAAALVVQWAGERGIPMRAGDVAGLRRTEAAWRAARWSFLRTVSAEFGAAVATAHTEDDQAETVFMRLLRGSGVRGLGGLLVPSPVVRPLLGVSRHAVRAVASAVGVPFLDDPSNSDLRYQRNRVRLELLPTLECAVPGFREWLLELGRVSAAWRADVAAATDAYWAPIVQDEFTVSVARRRDREPSREEAALFWPEVAGRVGVALDRRGTARLASFTTKRSSGLRMPLSGGADVRSSREEWTLQRAGASGAAACPPKRLAPLGA